MLKYLMFVFMGFFFSSLIGEEKLSQKNADPLEKLIEHAKKEVYPALINISVHVSQYRYGKKSLVKGGTGSGAIINAKEGLAFTNYHVAGTAEKITVTLSNLETVPAKLIGADAWTDIALIKLDLSKYKGEPLKEATFAKDHDLKVGQFVLAMGSPLGLSRSISFGVVSNKNRFLGTRMRLKGGEMTGPFNNWIQTDAAINPGNSGGPLVNLAGKIVGINSRGFPTANNIGLAIPAHIVKKVLKELEKDKKITRSYFGIKVKDAQGLALGITKARGAIVSDVDVGSPAEKAGVLPGDIILKVGDLAPKIRFKEHIHPFYKHLSELSLEQKINFEIERDGKMISLKITPDKLEASTGQLAVESTLGITIQTLPRSVKSQHASMKDGGVYVTSLKSFGIAASGGIRKGDILLSINDKSFKTIEEFKKLASGLEKTKEGLVRVYRQGQIKYVHIEIKK